MSIHSHFELEKARLRAEVEFWEGQSQTHAGKPEFLKEIREEKKKVEKMLDLCELTGEFLPQILSQSIADAIELALVKRDSSLPPASTMGQAVLSILTREGPMRYGQIKNAVKDEFPHLEFRLGDVDKSLGAALSYAVKKGKLVRVERGIYKAKAEKSTVQKGDNNS